MSNGKDIQICLGVDVDAVAGWLGSYGGEDSPNDIQRGMFAGEVGTPRLLKLFARYGLTTSWFIPGHSIETFPDQTRMVVDAGHEIGAHGYSHENPVSMTPRAGARPCSPLRRADRDRESGRAPRGYVAPWWEFVRGTAVAAGGVRVHAMTTARTTTTSSRSTRGSATSGPRSTTDRPRRGLDEAAGTGPEIDLVEFCGNWYVDDLPPMMFIKQSANSHGFVNPRDIEQMWRDQFDWVYREMDYAVFPVTHAPGRFRPTAGAADAGAVHRVRPGPRRRAVRDDGDGSR